MKEHLRFGYSRGDMFSAIGLGYISMYGLGGGRNHTKAMEYFVQVLVCLCLSLSLSAVANM